MNRDQAHDLLQRHQEALNRHDIPALVELYAPDAVIVSPMFDRVRGRQAIRVSYERLFRVFPDYRVEMSDGLFICEEDRAAEFSTATGTHSVELFGLPPTGHRIAYQAARLFTFRDGFIVAEHRLYDFGGVLERLEKTRLDRELQLASAVQHTLHGRPRADGAYFHARGASVPCRTVGGDFFDFRETPAAFRMAVGDVSGKGPAAALLAALTQGMLAAAETLDLGPGAVLTRLNRALMERDISPRFVTVALGRLYSSGEFVYSNAGNTPLIHLAEDDVRVLTAGGPMLAVFESPIFPEETVTLRPGESIVGFSDGVTDLTSPDEEPFGLERFIDLCRASRSASSDARLEIFLEALAKFASGAPSFDDTTLVTLTYDGDGLTGSSLL
jgi:steroid delta-isomerase-like uncharacterized protein